MYLTPTYLRESTDLQHAEAVKLAAELRVVTSEYGVQWQHPTEPLLYDVAQHVYRMPGGYLVEAAAGWAFREDGFLVAAGTMERAVARSFIDHGAGEAARLVAAWAMLDHQRARMTPVSVPPVSVWSRTEHGVTRWWAEGVQGYVRLTRDGLWDVMDHDGSSSNGGALLLARAKEYLADPEGGPASAWARDLLQAL